MANLGLGLDRVELHVPVTEDRLDTAQELKSVFENDEDIPIECDIVDDTLVADLSGCEPRVFIWETPDEETYRSERENEPKLWLKELWENEIEYLECASLSVPTESGKRAEELLHELGVMFDTGRTIGGESMDWDLDFSLEGASIQFID